MIASHLPTRHLPEASWQRQLAEAITDPRVLLRHLGLVPGSPGVGLATLAENAAFPLRVPLSYLRRMRPGDPADPLLRQVLPLAVEDRTVPGFVADPLGEAMARRAPGLLHKYRGRALLVTTGTCAVHCRYCFRREHDYDADVDRDQGRWTRAFATIAADPSIEELILSGGDPLSLGNARLADLFARIAALPQLRRVRLHTRTPVVLPDRVDSGLLALLRDLPRPPVIVLHVNHAQEIDADVAAAAARLRGTGAVLLNQSVLLAGVNDSADALADLSVALFDAGILPYYLHLLDRVTGVAHFEVGEDAARGLVQAIAARLPGYLVPRLVREEAGAAGKTPVDLRQGVTAVPDTA